MDELPTPAAAVNRLMSRVRLEAARQWADRSQDDGSSRPKTRRPEPPAADAPNIVSLTLPLWQPLSASREFANAEGGHTVESILAYEDVAFINAVRYWS